MSIKELKAWILGEGFSPSYFIHESSDGWVIQGCGATYTVQGGEDTRLPDIIVSDVKVGVTIKDWEFACA